MIGMLAIIVLCFCSAGLVETDLQKEPSWRVYSVPAEINTQQEINELPSGWKVVSDKSLSRLSGITIYDGTPDENASLVYDNELKQKNISVLTWRFTGGEKSGIWIVCHYVRTKITLKKRMPIGIKGMRITVDNSVLIAGLPEIKKIEYN